jgi:hypothetical protein
MRDSIRLDLISGRCITQRGIFNSCSTNLFGFVRIKECCHLNQIYFQIGDHSHVHSIAGAWALGSMRILFAPKNLSVAILLVS